MARNLYRFYLYAVFTAMLIFAVVGLGRLLQTLLIYTPLRGTNPYGPSAPASSDLVQSIVFFAVAWLIAGLVGGLHYWLIRRDMQSDPTAAGSPIRAFFLNIVMLITAPIGIGLSAFAVIMQLGTQSDVTGTAAFSLATLVLVIVLELERHRTQASPGTAMVFQRLHFYGVQLILLMQLSAAWFTMVSHLVDAYVFGGKGFFPNPYEGMPACSGIVCDGYNLLSLVAGTLWIGLFWFGYGYIARLDTASILRQILHFLSFAGGVGFLLTGLYRGIQLIFLAAAFKVSISPNDIVGQYDFVSPLTLGLLVIGVYSLWLRYARVRPEGPVTIALTAEAITTALLAAIFWFGVGSILRNTIEALFPGGQVPQATNWASALALLIPGLAYIPLDLFLRQRNLQDAITAAAPRRGLVFALIGGGALAGAIGGAVALYSLVTSLVGSGFDGWQHVARSGLSAFIVGLTIVGIYLWLANREHLFTGLGKPQEPAPAPPPQTETIEQVLDELLAGKITRDEAAARIRKITTPHPA